MPNANYILLGGPQEGLSVTIDDGLSRLDIPTPNCGIEQYIRVGYQTAPPQSAVVNLFVHRRSYQNSRDLLNFIHSALARVAGKVVK